MPFTFSHPAAVLPFAFLPARFISLTALIAGSLAPDFEYFFRMKVCSVYSHTWAGLFWFDLPVAVVLAFVFHLVVRNPLIHHLPNFFSKRLCAFDNFNWTKQVQQHFIVVIISALVGTATHLLWDGFTHADGLFVKRISSLSGTAELAGHTLPVYKLVQHISTVVGGLIILYAVLKLPAEKQYQNNNAILPFWFGVAGVAMLTLAIRFLTGLGYDQYGDIIITLLSGGMTGLLIASLLKYEKL